VPNGNGSWARSARRSRGSDRTASAPVAIEPLDDQRRRARLGFGAAAADEPNAPRSSKPAPVSSRHGGPEPAISALPGKCVKHRRRRCRGCIQRKIIAIECEFYAGGAGRLGNLDRAHGRTHSDGFLTDGRAAKR
jgi:hypothetical protein